MPHLERGMVVGLFGGSFNPPHEGHVLAANTALVRLRLHRLWWMVTPGNPLKSSDVLAPLEQRIVSSKALLDDPRICVTAFEEGMQTRYSSDTIVYILKRNPGVRFIWIMGSDNLAMFHRWKKWRRIVNIVPIAVIDRPGFVHADMSSPMAQTFSCFRVEEDMAACLAFKKAPAWTFVHGRRSSTSSTALRAL